MLRLKELRIEKHLTQRELAKKIDSTDKSIWAYEKGIAIPPLDVLTRLGDYFEVSIDYLTGREDDFGNINIQTNSPASPNLSTDEKELLNNFQILPEDLRRRAKAYLKKLVELNEEELNSKHFGKKS